VPSSEVIEKYRHGTLHSGKKVKGKKRKIVHDPKQAKAILLSYLRSEGKIGPRKNSKGKNHSRKRVSGKK
jgi:integrase